jgi:putative SOS response-associated peptidase YedK
MGLTARAASRLLSKPDFVVNGELANVMPRASYCDINPSRNLYGDFSFQTRYNIAPSQEVPVIICNEGRNEAKVMKLELVPSWAPD